MVEKVFKRIRNFLRLVAGVPEAYLLTTAKDPGSPQFFITGLPRTGTTLVYQYLVHRLHLAYFTNGAGIPVFTLSPVCVTWFQIHTHPPYYSDFKSKFGKVRGYVAPREAGGVWARFFDLENYETIENMKFHEIEILKRTVWKLQNIFGNAPFVNKNVKHMLRIEPLSRIFPQAYFIVVERDPEDVALSILYARKNAGGIEHWWSVRPPDYEKIKNLSPLEQIAHQVLSLRKKLMEDLEPIKERMFFIHYCELCEEPESVVRWVKEKHPVDEKNPPVPGFEFRKRKAETKEEKELVRLVKRIFERE